MEKLYYSISEVAEMFDINQSNLRFWEKEFKQLKPKRNKGNTRFYTNEDIELIKTIKFLVEDKKLTLDGVKQQLSQKKDSVERQQEIVDRLKRIKSELLGIANEIQ
ncbi:MAG: MerR family transcriptional regulator [Paludibacter sp.]|nr:MerR family transcriptional regulator [Paludibacter sp.]